MMVCVGEDISILAYKHHLKCAVVIHWLQEYQKRKSENKSWRMSFYFSKKRVILKIDSTSVLLSARTCWLLQCTSSSLFLPLSDSCLVTPDSRVQSLLLPCFVLSFIISITQVSPSTWHNICFRVLHTCPVEIDSHAHSDVRWEARQQFFITFCAPWKAE